jgi:endonuclease III
VASDDSRQKVVLLLERHGRTYAEEAGITLTDRPEPLYRLLVLATLLSARISADIAVAAARELFRAGLRSPRRMADASWQDRVDALGRGHYRRYDERTATMLGDSASMVNDRWHGDLRRLHASAGSDAAAARRLLTEFPGIGPTGADIFLREVQTVWRDLAPYADRKVLDGARRLGLPASPADLGDLVSPNQIAVLTSALVRVARDKKEADAIKGA